MADAYDENYYFNLVRAHHANIEFRFRRNINYGSVIINATYIDRVRNGLACMV